MSRAALLLTLLAFASLLGGSAIPAVAHAKAAKDIALSATVTGCKITPGPSLTGEAVFVGSMPRIAGATRMEMRFELLQASPMDGKLTALVVPKWGQWVKSQAGRPGFVYKKRIYGLAAPGTYRARITFQWRDAAGKVVRRVQRKTKACRQPDYRPNLTVTGVTVGHYDRKTDTVTYVVRVRNNGRRDAGAFVTRLAASGAEPLTAGVSGLQARGRVDVELEGPACLPGSTLDVAVDVDGVVDEANETDNAMTVACPVPRR